jgi:hypothetical protein
VRERGSDTKRNRVKLDGEARRFMIFIAEADTFGHKPLATENE